MIPIKDKFDVLYVCVCVCVCVCCYETSDWFTVGECDKLLVSTLLPTPIAQTTQSVLLVLGWTIFYFGMSFNLKGTGKTVTDIRTSQK